MSRDTYSMIPPKGSMLRQQAEVAVHFRRIGRELRRSAPYRFIEGLPWWAWYVAATGFAVFAAWTRDPGWMFVAAVYIFWGLWLRR